MNTERLLKLADVLENFKAERENLIEPIQAFDLREWKCGTAACACGTAGLHPWFRDQGFTLRSGTFGEPMFKTYRDFEAVEAFFEIDDDDSTHLFLDASYPEGRRGPKSVAKRIRSFVKKNS